MDGRITKGGKSKGGKPKPRILLADTAQVIPMIRGQGKVAGLTAKQAAFAERVASGATLADSYRAAYDAEAMSAAAIYTEASKLMDHPLVAQRVNAALAQKQAVEQHDAARIRRHVIESLHRESIDPNNPPSARVRALELLGKLDVVAVFSAKPQTDEAVAPTQELAATLEARLKALMDKAS
jgi:hypothetical protein